MDKKNILVFPCGSEIGLEIHRSIKYSTHFNLIGGSSVKDHGLYIYQKYIGNIPYHNTSSFIAKIKEIVSLHRIDAIYPTMDAVALTLKSNEGILGCRVIGSSAETTKVCASKILSYQKLNSIVPIPKTYTSPDKAENYPIFIKPDVGYGSRNTFLANDICSAQQFLKNKANADEFLLCEYLPGDEYTIDCFTDRNNNLLFSRARKRARISNGISVNTKQTNDHKESFSHYAKAINMSLKPRGAWFFQMKLDKNNSPNLLEVATRLGGSSSLFRSLGVNFALLSAFDIFDVDVSIIMNNYEPELDRALTNKYNLNIDYHTIYLDYDDCLLVDSQVNTELISFIYSAINKGKKIILITRHAGDICYSLKMYRISNLFDEVIHLTDKNEKKSKYIKPNGAIFIDDSHSERADVSKKHQIPVFSPDMIETLI